MNLGLVHPRGGVTQGNIPVLGRLCVLLSRKLSVSGVMCYVFWGLTIVT